MFRLPGLCEADEYHLTEALPFVPCAPNRPQILSTDSTHDAAIQPHKTIPVCNRLRWLVAPSLILLTWKWNGAARTENKRECICTIIKKPISHLVGIWNVVTIDVYALAHRSTTLRSPVNNPSLLLLYNNRKKYIYFTLRLLPT